MNDEIKDDSAIPPTSPASPPCTDSGESDGTATAWQRTKQGLGKVASTVASAGTTVASAATTVGGSAVSAATTVGTTSVTIATSAAKTAAAAGGHVVDKTGLGKAVEYLDGELDERGVKRAIGSAAGAVVNRLDQVTGKQLVELLESRLRLQDEYNDVLATRLAEALDRIAALEEKLCHADK